jgi:GTP-binding protein
MFHGAKFQFGAAEISQLPPDRGREVAFAGRSNAGKSSALNALANRRRLAFVSKTPGRTQQLNYYALGHDRYLVDLPGYGYARVPEAVQRRWEHVLTSYLQNRTSLRGLVLIMDARHPLTPLDRQMLDWFAPTGKPVLILLSKSDKLSRQETTRKIAEVSAVLGSRYPNCSAQLFSSVTRLGVDQARYFVAGLLTSAEASNGQALNTRVPA